MTEEKIVAKYKPLGIKVETYNRLNKRKNDLSTELGRNVSFDEIINELIDNAKE